MYIIVYTIIYTNRDRVYRICLPTASTSSLKIGLGMQQYQVIYKYQKYLSVVHAVTPYSYNDIGLYIFILIIITTFSNI